MDKPILMKDRLGKDAVRHISHILSLVIDDFPTQSFIADAEDGLYKLELKQRVDFLIVILAKYLPSNFAKTASILMALKDDWIVHSENKDVDNFAAWPLIDYVAVYGLQEPELSLELLKKLSPLFSAEFAIRPFIEQHFELSYSQLLIWCTDPDEHVRRLASEGIRPRLPWGKQLTQFCENPDAIFPILEYLKDDSSLYVRKSVANNLNDISKDHPDKVIALCQRWLNGATEQRKWLIRHALRSLVKAGKPEVFPLLGYTADPQVQLIAFELNKTILQFGQKIELSISLLSVSTKQQSIVVDYKVHYVKANGLTTSKVFKWKNISLAGQQQLLLSKQHAFKPISTRQYYSGSHSIEIMLNGISYGINQFELQIKT
ncbi:MAG: DNA alkylation repair protein [Methylophaga sp.]|nr:MAG: DNA alkylation repair protein [Methylophaga sp.]